MTRSADCPQVQALYDYHSEQPDELSLERGDKVFRKMADGMIVLECVLCVFLCMCVVCVCVYVCVCVLTH